MDKGKIFYNWMVEEAKISESSAEKYLRGVKAILKGLDEYRNEKINISDIKTIEEVEELKEKFLHTKELVEKNTRGKRMYSAGLNHFIRFIKSSNESDNLEENQELERKQSSTRKERDNKPLNIRKRKKATKRVTESKSQWPRNPKIVEDVLNYNLYICEVDKNHKFFVSKATNKNYVEGHHLIPMEFQENFNYSLDTEANIICLCPICHRMLHHGLFEEKKEVIKKLYEKHNENLINSGIEISLEDLLLKYNF